MKVDANIINVDDASITANGNALEVGVDPVGQLEIGVSGVKLTDAFQSAALSATAPTGAGTSVVPTGNLSSSNVQDALEELQDDIDNAPVGVHNHDADYSDISHTHTGFALDTHNHDADYSDISHNHDADYSDISHNHDADYSDISHTHTGFALDTHNHDADYSDISHNHDGEVGIVLFSQPLNTLQFTRAAYQAGWDTYTKIGWRIRNAECATPNEGFISISIAHNPSGTADSDYVKLQNGATYTRVLPTNTQTGNFPTSFEYTIPNGVQKPHGHFDSLSGINRFGLMYASNQGGPNLGFVLENGHTGIAAMAVWVPWDIGSSLIGKHLQVEAQVVFTGGTFEIIGYK